MVGEFLSFAAGLAILWLGCRWAWRRGPGPGVRRAARAAFVGALLLGAGLGATSNRKPQRVAATEDFYIPPPPGAASSRRAVGPAPSSPGLPFIVVAALLGGGLVVTRVVGSRRPRRAS